MRFVAIFIVINVVLALFILRAQEILTVFHIKEYGQGLVERIALPSSPRSTTPSQEEPAGSSEEQLKKEPEQPKGVSVDFGPVGSLNHMYLQQKPFGSLVVEVDYVKTMPPNQGALRDLFSTMDKYADKPGGIFFSSGNEFSSSAQHYTVDDLNAIMRANRSSYTADGTAAVIYIVYLNGVFSENEDALGVVWNASSIAIFKEQMSNALTTKIFLPGLERSVLFHELGHLWGLVNNDYQSELNHEDKNHPHHSSNTESAMYWAVEDVSVGNVLALGPPTKFDSDDEADLAKIKSGAY